MDRVGRCVGVDDTETGNGTVTASDEFTVEPSTARCSGTAAGHGVGTPWASSRSSTRTVLARVSPGGAATVTVTCTAAGYSPASAQALFSYAQRPQITSAATFAPADACTAVAPDRRTDADADADADAVWQCSLDEGAALAATLTVVAGTYRVSDAWNTAGGITAKVRTMPAAVPVVGPDNAATDDWRTVAAATLRCTTDGAVAAVLTAGRRPGHRTHTTRIRIDCQAPVAISGLDDRTGYGKTGATVAVAEDFTVEPADALCTAAPTGAVTAPDPTRPHHRQLTADIDIGTTAAVTVSCTADRRADSARDVVLSGVAADCDSPLGSVVHGVTVRDGAIAADPGCVSAGRGDQGVFYARRHTFTLDAAARVTVDIAGEAGLDAYAVLYRGRYAAAADVAGRDDNSGPRSDARLRSMRLAAGDYTIEATTAAAQATGGYRLTVRAVYSSPVRISALADAANSGTGAVTITEPFTVTPAAAKCTASPPAASVTARSGRRRAVSATLGRPGSLRVTVTCTAAGRGPAAADVTLTHAGALTSITARVTGGGGECTATTPPRRVDAAYRCTIGRGNTVTVAADTTATGPAIETAWTATGAISLASPAQRGAVPLFAPDNTVAGWQRTATVELECTAKGTATATATLAGTDAKKTARLVITCGDAVRIDGLADATDNGTGTLTVTSGFTVTPTAAVCTADPTTATVTAGVGGARTLTASIAVPGSLEVIVTCEAAGYTDGIRQVTLAAARPCSEHLGTLATGTVTRSGIITEGGCEAKARRPRTTSVFYARTEPHWARRHTFTLDTPGWVTISIANSPANTRPLDTYAVLLKDDDNKGTPVARNDNRSRRSTDARLTDLFLQPGSYTIEATTKQPQTAGNYDLVVDATVTGLKRQYNVTVDETLTIGFETGDHVASVRSITPPTLDWSTGHTGSRNYLAVTADMADTHRVVMALTRPSSTAEPALVEFNVKAACGTGLSTSIRNGHLCVPTAAQTPPTNDPEDRVTDEDRVTETDRGRKYPVTLGTLWGVKRVAKDARNAYMNPSPSITRDCTPTANRIAAIMLSIPLWEVPRSWWIDDNGDGQQQKDKEFYVQRDPGRSPMALSRKDREDALYPPAGNSRRAFWHPGVGLWQLDDPRTDFRRLNHAERAEIHIGGRAVADLLARRLCGVSESGMRGAINRALSPWIACRWNTSQTCYRLSYLNLWVKGTDDLHVTSYSTEYREYNGTHAGGDPVVRDHRSDYSTSGGLSKLQCRWEGFGDQFDCWFYDTDNPEGWMQDQDKPGIPGVISPLAAPFISFTHGEGNEEKRFAVFPESFLGTTTTLYRAVSVKTEVDMTGAGSWHEDDYGPHDRVLLVRVCRALGPEAGGACRWRSVHAGDLAKRLRDAGL